MKGVWLIGMSSGFCSGEHSVLNCHSIILIYKQFICVNKLIPVLSFPKPWHSIIYLHISLKYPQSSCGSRSCPGVIGCSTFLPFERGEGPGQAEWLLFTHCNFLQTQIHHDNIIYGARYFSCHFFAYLSSILKRGLKKKNNPAFLYWLYCRRVPKRCQVFFKKGIQGEDRKLCACFTNIFPGSTGWESIRTLELV